MDTIEYLITNEINDGATNTLLFVIDTQKTYISNKIFKKENFIINGFDASQWILKDLNSLSKNKLITNKNGRIQMTPLGIKVCKKLRKDGFEKGPRYKQLMDIYRGKK